MVEHCFRQMLATFLSARQGIKETAPDVRKDASARTLFMANFQTYMGLLDSVMNFAVHLGIKVTYPNINALQSFRDPREYAGLLLDARVHMDGNLNIKVQCEPFTQLELSAMRYVS